MWDHQWHCFTSRTFLVQTHSDQCGIVNSLLYILAMLQLPTSRHKGMPREAAFLDVSFWPDGDFNHSMSALIPPSAPALQLLKTEHDCFSPSISLSLTFLLCFSPFPLFLSFSFSPSFTSRSSFLFSCSSHNLNFPGGSREGNNTSAKVSFLCIARSLLLIISPLIAVQGS